MPNLKARFEHLVSNLASLKEKHIEQARAILKALLGPEILLHPCSDGEARFLTAELSGHYAGLLPLTLDENKGGGGHALRPSLVPGLISHLSFTIQGQALAR